MSSTRPLLTIPFLVAALGLGNAAPVWAQRVEATTLTMQVVDRGTSVDAQFVVTVTNREAAPATNVNLAFADGTAIHLGDVPAGASVSSTPQTRTIDTSALPTRHVPYPAMLTYTFGGQNVERGQALTFSR